MENLESLYKSRMDNKKRIRENEIQKQLEIRDVKLHYCRKFLEQIEFLNNYGFKWEIRSYCNNGNDCTMPYYGWNVYLFNPTIATSPFESRLIASYVDGEFKARFMHSILGCGRYVEGQDENGFFTAKQFVMAFSK